MYTCGCDHFNIASMWFRLYHFTHLKWTPWDIRYQHQYFSIKMRVNVSFNFSLPYFFFLFLVPPPALSPSKTLTLPPRTSSSLSPVLHVRSSSARSDARFGDFPQQKGWQWMISPWNRGDLPLPSMPFSECLHDEVSVGGWRR